MIKQIMDFSRRSASETKTTSLSILITELKRILEHTVPENIAITVEDRCMGQLLNADAAQITQALINLILNARDAMPRGGVIALKTKPLQLTFKDTPPLPEMDFGDWVMITVSDNGEGIAADVLPHIFEPFYTTKEPHKGTGLGLAQVYGIVRQHRGYIEVASQQGVGTVFTIYLPAIQPEGDSRRSTASGHEFTAVGRGETILLVEDNESLRETMGEVLETLDYGVLKASNGREALDVLEANRDHVRLVISDLIMPVMGGTELCHAIRQKYHDVEIVVMSGYSPEEDVHQLKLEGISHWLKKPISIGELSATVTELLH
jgi:CheY-like chemotaxis protein/two-component sensor histidine kinase